MREGRILVDRALAREHEDAPGPRRRGRCVAAVHPQRRRPCRDVLPDAREHFHEAARLPCEPEQGRAIDRCDHPGSPHVGELRHAARRPARTPPRRRDPAVTGCTSSITAWARRMSDRRMPPIWVRSNARWTSATNPPSVTTSRSSPATTVARGTASRPSRSDSRPIAASANNAYVAVAVGSARPAMIDRVAAQACGEPRRVGARLELGRDEDRRERDAGERDHAGGERAEDLLRGPDADRQVARPRPVAGRASGAAAPARSRPGSRRARAPTSPTPARGGRGTRASRR